jgi:2-polyprenyl-6-methoxyphenol hydroxylase-like FAD-dependent oxidoreductase
MLQSARTSRSGLTQDLESHVATIERHAIVLGGSIAGLLAARTLCDHFDRVTIVERDALPEGAPSRRGVPHDRHAHVLLSGGTRGLEHMFPGFTEELVRRGAELGDAADSRNCAGGVRLAPSKSDLQTLRMSRPLLEGYVRERALTLPRLRIIDRCDVLGLIGRADAIRGVRIVRRTGLGIAEMLVGDLVVDATGRGSRLPGWLAAIGAPAPIEERVKVNVGFASCTFRRDEATLPGETAISIGPAAPNRRCGVATAIEGDRWLVTLVGYLGDYPPIEPAGLLQFARSLPQPDLYELMRRSERLSRPVTARFPSSQRRRYERLDQFPDGLLAIGDALCTFNPVYGQGMSVAALEAEALDLCLRASDLRPLWERFFDAAARIIDAPWQLTLDGDQCFDAIARARTGTGELRDRYLAKLRCAAGRDPRLAQAFLRVTQLVEPPASLFAPATLLRVLMQREPAAHTRTSVTGLRAYAD